MGLATVGWLMLWFAPTTSLGWGWAAALAIPTLGVGMIAFDAGAMVYRLVERVGDRLLSG